MEWAFEHPEDKLLRRNKQQVEMMGKENILLKLKFYYFFYFDALSGNSRNKCNSGAEMRWWDKQKNKNVDERHADGRTPRYQNGSGL